MKRVKLKPRAAVPEKELKLLQIMVNPDWKLCYDGRQFIAMHKIVRKESKHSDHWWKPMGYLTNLETAVHYLAQRQIYLSQGVFDGRALERIVMILDEIKRDAKQAVDTMCRAILVNDKYVEMLATQKGLSRNLTTELIAVTNERAIAGAVAAMAKADEEPRVKRRVKIAVPDELRMENKHGMPTFLVRETDPKKSGVRATSELLKESRGGAAHNTQKRPLSSRSGGATEEKRVTPSPDRVTRSKPLQTKQSARNKRSNKHA